MSLKKATYNPLSRQDKSNPRNKFSHAENLKAAGIKDISKNHESVILPNGKLIVRTTHK